MNYKIYTPLKTGQALFPDVLNGLKINNCLLIPIVSESVFTTGFDFENMINNWNKAFSLCKEDVFVGMDSDVVLEEKSIEKLMSGLTGFDIAIIRTQHLFHKRIVSRPGVSTQHGCFALKMESLKNNLLNYSPGTCPMCLWVDRFEKINYLDFKLTEIKRAD